MLWVWNSPITPKLSFGNEKINRFEQFWPAGRWNENLIYYKLNNQLVNYRVTQKSISLLHLWKVRGIWILNQSKKVTVGVRYYGLQLVEKGLQFSRYIYFGHLVATFSQFWYAQSIFQAKLPPVEKFQESHWTYSWCWK